MPDEKDVDARHQTQQKLEVMGRYWGAWCSILGRARTPWFCTRHLWLVDTHAGAGTHLSDRDPIGTVPGTPLLAVLHARRAQRRHPDVTVHVRTSDKDEAIADRLEQEVGRYRGRPPHGVDVLIQPSDWVETVPAIVAEIAGADHPWAEGAGRAHAHRSLWFVDPFGVDTIPHRVLEHLPPHAELIVNFDLMGTLRHLPKARAGDASSVRILTEAFGGDGWQSISGEGESARRAVAEAYIDSFAAGRWKHRAAHPLRPSGSQDRALIHFTDADRAQETFPRLVATALSTETVIAGQATSMVQRDRAARNLVEVFGASTTSLEDVQAVLGDFDRGQIRAVLRRAADTDLGDWVSETEGTFEWAASPPTGRRIRVVDDQAGPTLWDLADGEGT